MHLSVAIVNPGSRFLAQVLDHILATAFLFIAALALLPSGDTVATISMLVLLYLGYFAVCEAVSRGATPGKASLGMHVRSASGDVVAQWQLLLRNLLRPIDIALFPITVMLIVFDGRSRRIGDMVAGTIVVRTDQIFAPTLPPPPLPIVLRTPDAGPAIDGLGYLGEREMRAVSSLLSRREIDAHRWRYLAEQMAHRLLDRMQLPADAPERRWPAELFLERLYLQLQIH